ncbi:hypothetical protein [Tropicimonas aquimaris]|uniref:Uncharacterized protein n=1 Tax=Tropicimonas aquimaris TaxID=914152 RepID=A0ABW3IIW9_9RHOB
MLEVAEASQWILDLLPRREEQKASGNADHFDFNTGGVWRGVEDCPSGAG